MIFLMLFPLFSFAAPVLVESNGTQAIVDVRDGGESALRGFTILCDSRKDSWCAPQEADLDAISVTGTGARRRLVVDEAKKAAKALRVQAANLAASTKQARIAELKEKRRAKTITAEEFQELVDLAILE